MMKNMIKKWNETSLILRIAIGLVIGAVLPIDSAAGHGDRRVGRCFCRRFKSHCTDFGFYTGYEFSGPGAAAALVKSSGQ